MLEKGFQNTQKMDKVEKGMCNWWLSGLVHIFSERDKKNLDPGIGPKILLKVALTSVTLFYLYVLSYHVLFSSLNRVQSYIIEIIF